MSDWPQPIYEEEGPVHRDGDGNEHCGWPRDGWRVELSQTGPSEYEIVEEREHIDGGSGYDGRVVDAAAAALWLADRAKKSASARRALERHFESATDG